MLYRRLAIVTLLILHTGAGTAVLMQGKSPAWTGELTSKRMELIAQLGW